MGGPCVAPRASAAPGGALDAALAALAAFLRCVGLEGAAAAVEAEAAAVKGCGAGAGQSSVGEAADGATLAKQLAALATCLSHLAAGCPGGQAEVAGLAAWAEEDWVDTLLRRVVASGARRALDAELAQRLDRALAAVPAAGKPGPPRGVEVAVYRPLAQAAPPAAAAPPVPAPPQAPPAPAAPAAPPSAMTGSSAHYVAPVPGLPPASWDPELLEEYRDDGDAGYRIRELLETELLAEFGEVVGQPAAGGRRETGGAAGGAALDFGTGGEAQVAVAAATAAPAAAPAPPEPAAGGDDELLHAGAAPPAAPSGGGASAAGHGDETATQEEGATPSSSSSSLKGLVKSAGSAVLAALGVPPRATAVEEATLPTFGAPGAADGLADGPPDGASGAGASGTGGAGGADGPQADRAVPQAGVAAAASQPPSLAAAAAAAAALVAAAAPAGPQPAQPASCVPLPYALAAQRKERLRGDRPQCHHGDSGDPFYPVELDGVVYDSFPLRVVYERDRTGFEEAKDFPIKINSIIAARYQVVECLGSAAFSRAVQCLDLHTNTQVCMKIIKNDKDFLDQSLDEIKLLNLLKANTDNTDDIHCLSLIDYFYHKEHLILVTELLRDNLYEFSKYNRESGDEPYFTLGRLQRIAFQVLQALEYIHSLWLIHADLKPENILIKSYSRCAVKVIDFGSSCFVDDQLTNYVQSRSYRAPEVILGLHCGQKIDLWSLGCIVAELWTGYVLFQNDSVQSLLARVIGIIGPFPEHMLKQGKLVPQYFTADGHLFREVADVGAAGGAAGAPQPGGPLPPPLGSVPDRRLHLFLPKRSSLRQRLRTSDELFIDFLARLLAQDPDDRPTATQALQHPWFAPGRYPDGLQ